MSSGAKLYVAYIVADPAGGLGLRFTLSTDMGLTWTAPVTLVAAGEASFGVFDVAITAGPADRVAVAYVGGAGTDPWVRGSTNAGVSWSAAVRVDAGVAAGTYPVRDPDIDIDGTGNVFVAYLQNRDGATKVWTARSLNAGTSFQPEVTLGSGSGAGAEAPDVEVTNDGKILIAFWDGELSDYVKVYRSTNQGAAYTLALNQDLAAGSDRPTFGPFLYNSAGPPVVLVAFVDTTGAVELLRSADDGATWGASQTLATTAVPAGSWSGIPSLGAARTSGGNWVIAWSDARGDTYADQKSDIWLRRSGTGGASWDAEKRVDVGSPEGAAQSGPLSITDALSNDVCLVYGDSRDDQRSPNLWSNRTLSSSINFAADKRIDTDTVTVDPDAFDDVATATDGAGRVYVAFSTVGTGPSSDIYVAVSDDGGFTFEPPVRVGGSPAGQRIAAAPVIGASSDGRVYLAYTLDSETRRELRFNRSTDFGSTWQASDRILGSFATPPGNYGIVGIPGAQIVAQAGGTMYLAWATGNTVFLTRSFDGGVTLDTKDVDQDTRGYNHYPALCANGNRLVLAMVAPDNTVPALLQRLGDDERQPRRHLVPARPAPTRGDRPGRLRPVSGLRRRGRCGCGLVRRPLRPVRDPQQPLHRDRLARRHRRARTHQRQQPLPAGRLLQRDDGAGHLGGVLGERGLPEPFDQQRLDLRCADTARRLPGAAGRRAGPVERRDRSRRKRLGQLDRRERRTRFDPGPGIGGPRRELRHRPADRSEGAAGRVRQSHVISCREAPRWRERRSSRGPASASPAASTPCSSTPGTPTTWTATGRRSVSTATTSMRRSRGPRSRWRACASAAPARARSSRGLRRIPRREGARSTTWSPATSRRCAAARATRARPALPATGPTRPTRTRGPARASARRITTW